MTMTKILVGIARSEGIVEGEALVSSQPISHFMYDIDNETGIVRTANHELSGRSVADKILVYPSVIGGTGGASSLFLKAKITKVGPKAIICRKVDPIDIAGSLDGEIPAVDGFKEDPIKEIRTGDWVQVIAQKVGKEALVKIMKRSK